MDTDGVGELVACISHDCLVVSTESNAALVSLETELERKDSILKHAILLQLIHEQVHTVVSSCALVPGRQA